MAEAYYLIELVADFESWRCAHILADIYFHDVHGSWTSEEPVGVYVSVAELLAVGGRLSDIEGWDGRTNYQYDNLTEDEALYEWLNNPHIESLEELKTVPFGTYVVPSHVVMSEGGIK